jgi:FHA domain
MSTRACPACGKTYAADYRDTFCVCGVELLVKAAEAAAAPVVAGPHRPPPGTRCLVLYSAERQPLQYFPLTKDVTLIGRLDAVEGSFPDIDVRPFVDEATARKMSRRHALILRSRVADSYTLRPLPGNTGTQIEADMVPAQADYALQPGTRMILGGAVRFKFEIT